MDSQLWKLEQSMGDSLSPLASSLYLNDFTVLSHVFRDLIRIFGYPPTLAPTVFQPKNNSRCHHRRSPRRTLQLRRVSKITIVLKEMRSLSFLNLQTSQIKNEEQSSKL
jgi:hypothetical protein